MSEYIVLLVGIIIGIVFSYYFVKLWAMLGTKKEDEEDEKDGVYI